MVVQTMDAATMDEPHTDGERVKKEKKKKKKTAEEEVVIVEMRGEDGMKRKRKCKEQLLSGEGRTDGKQGVERTDAQQEGKGHNTKVVRGKDGGGGTSKKQAVGLDKHGGGGGVNLGGRVKQKAGKREQSEKKTKNKSVQCGATVVIVKVEDEEGEKTEKQKTVNGQAVLPSPEEHTQRRKKRRKKDAETTGGDKALARKRRKETAEEEEGVAAVDAEEGEDTAVTPGPAAEVGGQEKDTGDVQKKRKKKKPTVEAEPPSIQGTEEGGQERKTPDSQRQQRTASKEATKERHELPAGTGGEAQERKTPDILQKKKKKNRSGVAAVSYKHTAVTVTMEDVLDAETVEVQKKKKKKKKVDRSAADLPAVTEDQVEQEAVQQHQKTTKRRAGNAANRRSEPQDCSEQKSTKNKKKKRDGELKGKQTGVTISKEGEIKTEKMKEEACSASAEEEPRLPQMQIKDEGESGGAEDERKVLRKISCEAEGFGAGSTEATEAQTERKRKRKKEVGKERKMKQSKVEPEEPESPSANSLPDVVFLSRKVGNKDEQTIDQDRRRALQTELEQASHTITPLTSPACGQWGTAQFESDEKQLKFLRLMGGLKKGAVAMGTSTGRANMALGRQGQLQLQQKLQGEFERAQQRHTGWGGRGAGLGFLPPPDRKASIDIHARRSVRLDG